MDIKEIKKQFKELSDKMQDGLIDNPEMSLLLNSMTMLFGIMLNQNDEASKESKELVKGLLKQIDQQTKQLDQQAKQLEKQAKQIEKLTEAIANKTLTNKRVSKRTQVREE